MQGMQLYRYVLDNHKRLSLYELCSYVENLHLSKLADGNIGSLLMSKLIDSLEEVLSPAVMGRVLYLINKCPSMDDECFVMITNHIYRNRLYPSGDVPRVWGRYFKFIGDNRIYHRELLEVLSNGFAEYLGNSLEHSQEVFTRRVQEAVAITAWALAICAPNMPFHSLFDVLHKLSSRENMERSVLIRVFWSMAVRNRDLHKLDPAVLERLLNETLADPSVGLRKKSHIHQIYTVLRCMKLGGIDVSALMTRCLEVLGELQYGQNDSKISTSQRYVSDVLVRLGVPHKLELVTPDLLSIDIAIEGGGEKIALEVDGPLHFTRICDSSDNSVPMKTGPTQIKQAFLRSNGWSVLSVPPLKLDETIDLSAAIASIDAYYRRILLESGSTYLRTILQ
ncbi:hypothetical protein BgAZ_106620 [Babesia gibsoni]|uniref:RAP domain-containing protein n=1 Tax=Babesia gibsoni TaxID=33632 RepID=A0AAD8PG19_BABGI|nr:hypothetical protein BgAZ_106620 [Babesia gibsoni]